VCDDSDQPFDELKAVVGQFGKSKWQSYFELLCLPLEMQGLKPNIPMGKLKQSLLQGRGDTLGSSQSSCTSEERHSSFPG
jgi:hypothetical protein